MPELPQMSTLVSLLADIDRRLRALETAPVANHMSVLDGSFQVLDAALNTIVFLGKFGSSYGMMVSPPPDTDGLQRPVFRVNTTSGVAWPWLPIPVMASPVGGGTMQVGFASLVTNSGTMTELYRGDFASTAGQVQYDLSLVLGGGVTSADWQLTCAEVGGGTPTVIASASAVTVGTQYAATVAIPSACLIPTTGVDPRGRSLTLRLSARVAGGAGFVTIAPNSAPLNR